MAHVTQHAAQWGAISWFKMRQEHKQQQVALPVNHVAVGPQAGLPQTQCDTALEHGAYHYDSWIQGQWKRVTRYMAAR